MAKRRNENGQMRREEYEAEDDDYQVSADSFEKGFQRASDESIRARKIVKARVGGRPAAAAAALGATNGGPAAAKSANPFNGFGGLAAAAPAPKANPFAGFSGLATGSSTTTSAAPVASTGAKKTPATYQEAIEVLNKEFYEFVNAQAKANPSSSWVGAVEDYLKHAGTIATKFASTKPVPIGGTSRAPAPAPAANTNGAAVSKPAPASFGSAKKTETESSTKAAPPASTGFSFGASVLAKPATSASTASTGFSFGAAKSAASSTGSFSLGADTATNANAPATLPTKGFSFGATTSKPSTSPVKRNSAGADAAAKPAAASTGGFSFGASASKSAVPALDAPSGFTFGAAPAGSNPSSGFSFGAAPTLKPASTTAPATGGFTFGAAPAASSSSAPKPFTFGASTSSFGAPKTNGAAATEGKADDDEENIGREEATVIIKSDSPDDECVFDADKVKIFEFKKDEKRWADKGVHPLKVLVNKETKKARILMRNEIGKIVLNASLYKGMAVKTQEGKDGKKNGVILSLQVEGAMMQFLLKLNAAKVDSLETALNDAAKSS